VLFLEIICLDTRTTWSFEAECSYESAVSTTPSKLSGKWQKSK